MLQEIQVRGEIKKRPHLPGGGGGRVDFSGITHYCTFNMTDTTTLHMYFFYVLDKITDSSFSKAEFWISCIEGNSRFEPY